MPWDLDNDRPIYLQLMERIQQDIIAGIYNPGDKLPSVRDLALECFREPQYHAESALRTRKKRPGIFAENQRQIYHGG